MIPQRFVPSQSNIRKSRLGEGRPSMLPKPRRPCSTDRLSAEARRPSAGGPRSSSAEPSRTTVGGRLSREASATKLPTNGRSRSQQGDRFGQSLVTPMRSSQYAARPTTTPQTPSTERRGRTWQTSLDRVLAFVTIKDHRAISTAAWQRSETGRVQQALAARDDSQPFVRPLTITRFVDITAGLLAAISPDTKLNNDNYVTKLPHLTKRLLYPAPVSKSWLRTVNTLHAFPQALALVAYLLDLVNDINRPVDNDPLYAEKEELARLRQEYLRKCWVRFQSPLGKQFEDLRAEYLQQLEALLGNGEDGIQELQGLIKKYEQCLEDETEQAARAEEARIVERRNALLSGLRAERAARRELRALADVQRAAGRDLAEAVADVDAEIERANAESQQLRQDLETQEMSVAERTRLLDEVDYAMRVQDSKGALADQIAKMVLSKETELALWQKKALDCCVKYKQGLIHLSARFPQLAQCAIDEKELMGSECAQRVSLAVEALRQCAHELQRRRAELGRARTARDRRRDALLEEMRTKVNETKASVQREQESLEAEVAREAAEAADWSRDMAKIRDELEALQAEQRNYARVDQELQFWEKQEQLWRSKLTAMQAYIESKRDEAHRLMEAACSHRTQVVADAVSTLNDKLARL